MMLFQGKRVLTFSETAERKQRRLIESEKFVC